MVDDSDWRLQGQESYLHGVALVRRDYRPRSQNKTWDHDHCEFCHAKFMVGGENGSLGAGYATLADYRWICDDCFHDFKARFQWTLTAPSATSGDA